MSEKEIIIQLGCILDPLCMGADCLEEKDLEAIRCLYDLYNKEKEKNEKLEWKYKKLEHKYKILRCDYKFTHEMERRDMIYKFQIIRKIKEYDNIGMTGVTDALKELLEEE